MFKVTSNAGSYAGNNGLKARKVHMMFSFSIFVKKFDTLHCNKQNVDKSDAKRFDTRGNSCKGIHD